MEKYKLFLRLAKALNAGLNITPLLFGSLGLEQRLGMDLHADDIDILVPEYYLHDGWQALTRLMEQLGYELYDLHEHAFRSGELSVAFAGIENLIPFAGINIAQIPMMNDGDAAYLLLELPDYQKVYEASSKDGYRVYKKEKKDYEKLALIMEALNRQSG